MAKPQSFKKGDKRINRNGAPKKDWTWASLLKEALEKNKKVNKVTKPLKTWIAEALMLKAATGDPQAIKIIMDRMDGMPSQALKHEGSKDAPFIIEFTNPKDDK